MGILRSLPTEVFLSYARIDDQTRRAAASSKWVSAFKEDLSQQLASLFGDDVTVWMDDRLKRSEEFDNEIPEQLSKSAVFVVVLSPGYLNSPYCMKELDWFVEQAKASSFGLKLKNHRRIMPVRIYDLPPEQWPNGCQDVNGGEFFKKNSRSPLKAPIALNSEDYNEEIERFAGEIYELIRAMKEEEPPDPDGGTDGSGGGPDGGGGQPDFLKTFAMPIYQFEIVLNESPELKTALIRDYDLKSNATASEVAVEIASQINSNFAPWLFQRLLKIKGAKREDVLRLAGVSVFFAMSPTYAARIREQVSKKKSRTRAIEVPSNAGKAVTAMIKAWAVGAEEALAEDGDEEYGIEAAESGPAMTLESVKRILCEKLEIPWKATDRDRRLKGALLAELSSFTPYYLVEENDSTIEAVMNDPALTSLFVLIRDKETSMARGEDSVAYVEAVERLLNKFQKRMNR